MLSIDEGFDRWTGCVAGGRSAVDHRLVNLATHADGAHRHGAVGQPLGAGHQVGRDAQGLGRRKGAQAAEAGALTPGA